jgi:hypothetical protein
MTTYLGTDTTVLVHLGVLFTNNGTARTRAPACAHLFAYYFPIRAILTHQDLPGGMADVGTIRIHQDAACKVMQMFFCEASVGAGRASRGTGDTCLNTLRQLRALLLHRIGMCFEHYVQDFFDGCT